MTGVTAFDSPRLTLKRAKHHIRDLKEVVDKFTHEHPWTYLIDAESQAPNFVHKYRFHKLVDFRRELTRDFH
jgi:NifB/MoaA-like Fe-S oxidoreductase